jgi:dUTP pyrophosphatase
MNDYWSEKKVKNVNAIITPTPANNYFKPNLIKINTKIKADEEEFIPKYQTADSVCADLLANLQKEQIEIVSGGCYVIDCGFSMELPRGYKACIASRSGWASKGLIVNNAPGQVDSDYRGRIKICVTNISQNTLTIKNKDRIGQIWIEPVYFFDWEISDNLTTTFRQDGGFGSTGK